MVSTFSIVPTWPRSTNSAILRQAQLVLQVSPRQPTTRGNSSSLSSCAGNASPISRRSPIAFSDRASFFCALAEFFHPRKVEVPFPSSPGEYMSGILIAGLLVVVALVIWVALQSLGAQKKSQVIESQMSELRHDLQSVATAQAQATGQITALASTVTQRLDMVGKSLTDGVVQSAAISAQGQSAMREELKSTQGMMERIHKQLGEFQEVSRGLSNAQQSLESVLGGAKTRGILGEVTLERLLEDSLPSSQYPSQYRFASGECVDAAIFLRDKKILAIDSKFPLDAFRRIQTEGEEARRGFVTAVKLHTDSVAKKYILPGENTLDLALMFVPSESVYYELLQCADSK